MKKTHFDFTISGFVISIIIVAMVVSTMAVFYSSLASTYGVSDNSTLELYDQTESIINQTENMKNNIEQAKGGSVISQALDIVGIFFSNGWATIVTVFKSFDLFNSMLDQAGNDVLGFNFFKPYIIAILIVMVFVGVGLGVLLKWRV